MKQFNIAVAVTASIISAAPIMVAQTFNPQVNRIAVHGGQNQQNFNLDEIDHIEFAEQKTDSNNEATHLITIVRADQSRTEMSETDFSEIKVELQPAIYAAQKVTDKSGWKVLYGSKAVYGPYTNLFDNNHGNSCHVPAAEGYPHFAIPGDRYWVIDLGQEYPLAQLGADVRGGTGHGWYDCTPKQVDFYYSAEKPAVTVTDEEYALLSNHKITDEFAPFDQTYIDLDKKLADLDKANVNWIHIGSAKCEDRTGKVYVPELTVNAEHLADAAGKPVNVRYIKVVVTPFTTADNETYGTGSSDAMVNEITLTAVVDNEYLIADLDDKERWEVTYSTPRAAWVQTNPKVAFDNQPAHQYENCWYSHWFVQRNENETPLFPDFPEAYFVVDLGQPRWLAGFGAATGGWGDTTFKSVEFFVTSQSEITTGLSVEETELMNYCSTGAEENDNPAGTRDRMRTLMSKVKELDNNIEWVKIGEVTSNGMTNLVTYNNDIPDAELDKVIKSRYVKVKINPYSYTETKLENRVSLAEIYLKHVIAHNGKPTE